jgi:hypothetical protein
MQNLRMRNCYVPVMHCEKIAVIDTSFLHRAVIEVLVSEGNSAGIIYEQLCGVYGDACMGATSARSWVKHFKDGNAHRRPAALWSTENCCN